MTKTVIVTVPHATGSRADGPRRSDVAALHAAEAVIRELDAYRDIEPLLLTGDVARRTCDLNRAEPCDSPERFKEEYRRALAQQPAMVIDMHSFPASHTWGARVPPAVALLHVVENRDVSERAARVLARVANVHVVAGSQANYVITEASRAQVPSVLVEINEGLADVTPIAAALAAFVATEVEAARYTWPSK